MTSRQSSTVQYFTSHNSIDDIPQETSHSSAVRIRRQGFNLLLKMYHIAKRQNLDIYTHKYTNIISSYWTLFNSDLDIYNWTLETNFHRILLYYVLILCYINNYFVLFKPFCIFFLILHEINIHPNQIHK